MATTIQRRGTLGDSTAPRVPFPLPGAQPVFRVSSLSLQGNAGDPVTQLPNLGTSTSLTRVTNSNASTPTMQLYNGVPVIRMVQNPAAATGLGQDGFYGSGLGSTHRTQIAVLRFLTLPDNTSTGNPHGHIVRGSSGGNSQSMSVMRTSASSPGALQVYGSGSTGWNSMSRVTAGGGLQFVAVTHDGSNSITQVDSARSVVTATAVTSGNAEVVIGFNKEANYTFDLVELEVHSVVLSAAALDERLKFYRALYQF